MISWTYAQEVKLLQGITKCRFRRYCPPCFPYSCHTSCFRSSCYDLVQQQFHWSVQGVEFTHSLKLPMFSLLLPLCTAVIYLVTSAHEEFVQGCSWTMMQLRLALTPGAAIHSNCALNSTHPYCLTLHPTLLAASLFLSPPCWSWPHYMLGVPLPPHQHLHPALQPERRNMYLLNFTTKLIWSDTVPLQSFLSYMPPTTAL